MIKRNRFYDTIGNFQLHFHNGSLNNFSELLEDNCCDCFIFVELSGVGWTMII